jgi:hypothetical protein
VVRLVEKHVPGGGIYWSGPHVAEIYSIGMVYGGLRLSVAVRRHAEGHLAISRVRSLRYRLSRLTPQPPGNVRWRSMRSPPERVCTPDKPTVTEIVLSD